MNTHAPELKRIVNEVIGAAASRTLMNRIFVTLDDTSNPQDAVAKVEKLVALFLGSNHASALKQSLERALG